MNNKQTLMAEFLITLKTPLVYLEAEFHPNNSRQMVKFYCDQFSISKTSVHFKGKHIKCILNFFSFTLV